MQILIRSRPDSNEATADNTGADQEYVCREIPTVDDSLETGDLSDGLINQSGRKHKEQFLFVFVSERSIYFRCSCGMLMYGSFHPHSSPPASYNIGPPQDARLSMVIQLRPCKTCYPRR